MASYSPEIIDDYLSTVKGSVPYYGFDTQTLLTPTVAEVPAFEPVAVASEPVAQEPHEISAVILPVPDGEGLVQATVADLVVDDNFFDDLPIAVTDAASAIASAASNIQGETGIDRNLIIFGGGAIALFFLLRILRR